MRLTLWTAFAIFVFDQATKWAVVHWMNLSGKGVIEVAPPYLVFRMAWNRGVNFGLFSSLDMRWALIALALVISGLVLWWIRRDGGVRAVAGRGQSWRRLRRLQRRTHVRYHRTAQ